MRKVKKILVYFLVIVIVLSEFSQSGLTISAKESDAAEALETRKEDAVNNEETGREDDAADIEEAGKEEDSADTQEAEKDDALDNSEEVEKEDASPDTGEVENEDASDNIEEVEKEDAPADTQEVEEDVPADTEEVGNEDTSADTEEAKDGESTTNTEVIEEVIKEVKEVTSDAVNTQTRYQCFKNGETAGNTKGYTSVDEMNSSGTEYDGYVKIETDKTTVTVTPYAAEGYEFMILNLTGTDGTVSTPLTKDYRKKVDADGTAITAETIAAGGEPGYSFTVDSQKATGTGAALGTVYSEMPAISASFDPVEGLLNEQLINGNLFVDDSKQQTKGDIRSWIGPVESDNLWGTLHVGIGNNKTDAWNGVDCGNGDYITYYAGEGSSFVLDSVCAYSRLGWSDTRFVAEIQGSYDNTTYQRIAYIKGQDVADVNNKKNSVIRATAEISAEYPYIRLYARSNPTNVSLLKLYGEIKTTQVTKEYLFFKDGKKVATQTELDLNNVGASYDGYVETEVTDGEAVKITIHAAEGYEFMMLNLTDENGNISTPLTKDYRKTMSGGTAGSESMKNQQEITYSFAIDADQDSETDSKKIGTRYRSMPTIAVYFDSSQGILNEKLLTEGEEKEQQQDSTKKPIRKWLGPVTNDADSALYGTLHVGTANNKDDFWNGADSAEGDYVTYYAGDNKAFEITQVCAYSRLGWPDRFDAEVLGSYDNANYEQIAVTTKGTSNALDKYSIRRQTIQTSAKYPYIRLRSRSKNADISLIKLYGDIVEAQELTPVEKYIFFKEGNVVVEQDSLTSLPSEEYEGYVKVSTIAGKSVTVTVTAKTGYDFMMLNLTDEEGNVTTPLTKDWIRDGKGGCAKNENGKNTCGFIIGADETLTGIDDIGSQYKEMPVITAFFSKSDQNLLNNTLLEMTPYDKKISDEAKPVTSWMAQAATLNVNKANGSWTGVDVKGGDYVTYSAGKGKAFHLEELDIYSRWGFSDNRFGAVLEASNDGANFVPILTAKNTPAKEKYSVKRINRAMLETEKLKVRMLRLRAVSNPADVCLMNIYGTVEDTDSSELSELKAEDDLVDYPEIKDPVTWLEPESEAVFFHPGVGVTKDELINVRNQVEDKKDPWYSYYTKMLSTKYASREFTCNNAVNGEIKSDAWSVQTMELTVGEDAQRAYTQTLLYVITGDETYRSNAMKIIRIYEQMDPAKYSYYVDAHIHAPTPVYKMIQAAELLRYTACTDRDLNWTKEDTEKFTKNFIDPACSTFLDYNDKFMNQHNFPLLGTISAAIFKDDMQEYKEKVEWMTVNETAPDPYFTGSIKWLFRWTDDTEGTGKHVQLVEMGRDLAHAGDDVNTMSILTRMLWLQGTKVDPESGTVSDADSAVNIYEYLDHAVMRGADYFCKYDMGYDIDWNPVQTDKNGSRYTRSSDEYRGRLYLIGLADLYYMYRYQLGYTEEQMEELAPYFVKAFRERSGPTYYAVSSGEATDLGISGADERWLHIPENVSAADGTVPESCPSDRKYIFEMDRQYSIIDGSNEILTSTDKVSTKTDGGTGYIHTVASEGDTRFAVYNVSLINRKGEAKVSLRIRTNGRAVVEIKSEDGSQPFQTLVLPDTDNAWSNIVFDMGYSSVTAGQYPTNTHLMYFNVVGDGSTVDFDHINVNATGTLTTPEFNENTDSVVRLVGYVGSAVSWDFSAEGGNPFEDLSYMLQCVQGEQEDVKDAKLDENGQFTWTPNKAGAYKWYVVVSDKTTLSLVQLEVTVAADKRAAVESVREGIDWSKEYLSISVLDFDTAEQEALACIDKSDDAFKNAMEALMKAANSMEELNPQLSDGTLDFSKMVKATSLETGKTANLTDNNSVSHTGDLYAKYFTLDFGAFFRIKATAFRLQARNIWPNRTEGCVVMGSVDGENWDTLTEEAPGCDDLTTMQVKAEYQNRLYRYFKLSTAGTDTKNHMASTQKIFSLGELRIVGIREEIDTQLRSVSVSTDASALTNHIGDTKYVQSYPRRAKEGNKITLELEAKREISDVAVTIAGLNAAVTQDNTNPLKYTAQVTLTSDAAKANAGRNVEFCITYQYQGKPGSEVRMTTDGTSVFVTDDEGMISLKERYYDSSANSTGIENKTQDDLKKGIANLEDNNSKTISDERQADGAGSGSYLIVDFGEGKGVSLSRVEILGRLDMLERVMGIYVQGSNDYDFEAKTGTWISVTGKSLYCEEWQGIKAANSRYYRYLRFINDGNWYGNMSELRIYGDVTEDTTKIVDVSDLYKLIKEAEKKNLEEYQEEGKAEFKEALEAAQKGMTDTALTQEEINTLCERLQSAMDNLKIKEETQPDKTALSALIEEAEKKNLEEYQEEGKAEFKEALEAAQKGMTDTELTQEEINTLCERLQSAMDNLKIKEETKPDKTALSALIEEAEKKNLEEYQEEGKAEFKAALEAAQQGMTDAALTQEEINILCERLQTAMDNLKLTEFVDAPTADVPSGKVDKGTKITLICLTGEASIYYTTDGSEPTAENGTLYENPIIVNETVTIKAIAVKGKNTSTVSTFSYEVSDGNQGGDDKPIQVSAPTADKASGTELLLKGTRITLSCATEGAVIYYTTDTSEPAAEEELLYKNPIPVNRNMTIKAIAVKEQISSPVAVFTYTVSTGLRITVDGIPYVCTDNKAITTNAAYIYTGSAITPEVTVINNGELLANGTDYTIKYANNVKTPAANAKSTQQPQITIVGKNNLKGNAVLYFKIQPKSIAFSEEGILASEPLVIVENQKASPVLYYNGQILKINKDFTMSAADKNKKWTSGDSNQEITLTGMGNYTGERKIKVNVVGKKDLQKFKVEPDADMGKIVYDGKEHAPRFVVYNAKDSEKTQISPENYYVVMSGDSISAGTKKYTVVGTGMYTGCSVTKSYTIRPCTDSSAISIDISGLKQAYAYNRKGTIVDKGDFVVKGNGSLLQEGRDYRIICSGNKKVTDSAKYSIAFLGNYKGIKNVTNQKGTFKIVPADLSRQNYQAAALDQIYTKPAFYKTKLYVTVDNVLLKASDYTVTYKLSDGTQMSNKNKLDLSKTDGTVMVQIQGKGNYSGTIETSYKVCKPDNIDNLAKAKVTVVDKNGNKLKNVQFDGNAQTVSLKIEVKDGKTYRKLTEKELNTLDIIYVNNVYKGKATVIINGDGKTFVGGKAVTFHIESKNIAAK